MKQRNHAFDVLCGLCIIRMISLHTMQFCGLQGQAWWTSVMEWTFFFMSFFFFKAGYFNKGVMGDHKTYVLDRTKRLLVPYMTAGLIGFLIYMAFMPFLINRYHHPVEPLSWDHIWTQSQVYGNAPVWFLFSFYLMYLSVHFLEHGMARLGTRGRWLLTALVCPLPALSYYFYTQGNPIWMSLNNLPIGIFFFYLGHWWHKAIDRYGKHVMLWVSALMVAAFIASNILWHGQYSMSMNEFKGDFIPTIINTTLILCGLSGLLLTTSFPRIPGLCYIGEHSMVYFISHYPMLYFYRFTHLSFGRSIYGRYDDVIILLPAIFMICSWFVPYVESTPWLSGRWKKATSTPTTTPTPPST